jgi:hypothetical protein
MITHRSALRNEQWERIEHLLPRRTRGCLEQLFKLGYPTCLIVPQVA